MGDKWVVLGCVCACVSRRKRKSGGGRRGKKDDNNNNSNKSFVAVVVGIGIDGWGVVLGEVELNEVWWRER